MLSCVTSGADIYMCKVVLRTRSGDKVDMEKKAEIEKERESEKVTKGEVVTSGRVVHFYYAAMLMNIDARLEREG